LAPSYPLAIVAFAAVGAANAPYFTADLGRPRALRPARGARPGLRLAGRREGRVRLPRHRAGRRRRAGLGARPLLAAAAMLSLAGAALAVLDRRCTSAVP
jgi:hypothetical protein